MKGRERGTEVFFGGVRDSRGDLMRKEEKRERGAKARNYVYTLLTPLVRLFLTNYKKNNRLNFAPPYIILHLIALT